MLIIDDDDVVRRTLARMFVRSGYSVETADDGAPAIALDAHFDLLICDFHMKTVTGDAVVRHFKQRCGRAIYCAVLTGSDDDDIRRSCLAAGADAFFSKPAAFRLLTQKLRAAVEALRQESPLHP